MSEIDWNAKAVLHRRDDAGSELHYHFDRVEEGTLAAMIRKAAALPSDERARLILDVAGRGNLDIQQILALAADPSLPAS